VCHPGRAACLGSSYSLGLPDRTHIPFPGSAHPFPFAHHRFTTYLAPRAAWAGRNGFVTFHRHHHTLPHTHTHHHLILPTLPPLLAHHHHTTSPHMPPNPTVGRVILPPFLCNMQPPHTGLLLVTDGTPYAHIHTHIYTHTTPLTFTTTAAAPHTTTRRYHTYRAHWPHTGHYTRRCTHTTAARARTFAFVVPAISFHFTIPLLHY